MQAILAQDVDGLGKAGNVVNVSRGYLRNYLMPRKLAELATPAKIEEATRRMEAEAAAKAKRVAEANNIAELLNRTILTLKAKAGGDGRLFGSITPQDIADAIKDARQVEIDRHDITIDPPIRQTGTYTIPVQVVSGVMAEVKTIVSPLVDES
ncbi:MAG TPA: 50S ribosomal protein L9 [Miltoncostaeales bacterium]|nr:50S ribosomal protein L9 [Miltoncostaeales bacterium]